MARAILYTKNEGGVAVCYPMEEMILWMQFGGYWADRPRGFVEEQIRRQVEAGIHPDHARRYAHAVCFGGCTTPEAWEIIRDRDCTQHGSLFEIIDTTVDLPPDRFFRDAWVRSANGGPAFEDLKKSQQIMFKRLRRKVEAENKRRLDELEPVDPLNPNWDVVRRDIMRARDTDELRRVTVEGLQ